MVELILVAVVMAGVSAAAVGLAGRCLSWAWGKMVDG